jgi:hypothetical protein
MSGYVTKWMGYRAGVACAIGLNATIAVFSFAVPVALAAGNDAPKNSSAPLSDEERAKHILAAEKSPGGKLHPLQLAAPDYNIVVCEAGCGTQGAYVVYRIAKTGVRSVVLDAKVSDRSITKNADCQGGCEGNRTGRSSAVAPTVGTLPAETGNWMTAPVAQPTAKAAPMASITPPVLAAPVDLRPVATDATPAPVAPTVIETPKPVASAAPAAPEAAPHADAGKPATPGSREDWLARINRERAADKAATTTTTTTVTPKT